MLDEQFKARVEATLERLLLIVEGNEHQTGLVHEMQRLTRMTEGGLIAVKVMLFLGSVSAALAASVAWLHDKVTWK